MSPAQCSKKWQNLLRTYKIGKNNKKLTGHGSITFNFFHQMDNFLGSQASNCSPHSIDEQTITVSAESESNQTEEASLDESNYENINPNSQNEIVQRNGMNNENNIPLKRRTNPQLDYFKAKSYLEMLQQELKSRQEKENIDKEKK